MPALRSRLAWLFVGPLAAAILVFVPAIGVRAATPITFGISDFGGLMIGNPCIGGMAAVTQPIRIVWKSASGHLKARVDMTTTLGGSWEYCSETKQLRAGDTIKAVVEGTSRTLTMIDVSVASDRRTEFHGRGPANLTCELWYSAGIFADYQDSATVTSDSNGRWSVVIPDGLMGGLFAEVYWQTAQGDTFIARMYTPYVRISLNEAAMETGGSSGSSAIVKLLDPSDDSVRGKAAVAFDVWGSAKGEFMDKLGNPVAVHAGDRVVSRLAPDLDWLVPDVTGTANVAKDLVPGVCEASGISATDALVRTFRAGKSRGVDLTRTEADGSFVADFNGRAVPFHRPADIKPGDTVTIDCYYDTGDIVATSFVVP